jgi:3-methyladenine DNA glycosylase Tag
MTIPFKTIRARAEKRKGGPKALNKLLPPKPDPKALAKLGDDRVLAEMTRRAFSAGFAWSVIEAKWHSNRAGCRCSPTSSGTA